MISRILKAKVNIDKIKKIVYIKKLYEMIDFFRKERKKERNEDMMILMIIISSSNHQKLIKMNSLNRSIDEKVI